MLQYARPPYFSAFLLFVTITGSHADCPLQISPPIVVVRYGSSVSVNCSTSVQHNGMGWESTPVAVPMSKVNLTTWRVSSLTDYKIEAPFCYINPVIGVQCESYLPVTVYKTPDSVSISTGTHTGPVIEGNQYELQCDVLNVAPVQNLIVRWYKGQTLVDQTSFTDTTRTPVNESVKLLINPEGADDGVQYRCEAELDLGEEGPRPPPTVTSEPLSITVYYKPKHSSLTEIINIDNEVMLNCTVKSNPASVYTWHSEHLKEQINTPVLLSSTPGNYTCTALNDQGKGTKVFILRSTGRTTFWAIIGCGIGVAVVLIVCYIVYKLRASPNSVI